MKTDRTDSGLRYNVFVYNLAVQPVEHLCIVNVSWNRALAYMQQWAADRERAAFNPDASHPEWVMYPFISMEGVRNG